jgi:hypothetical protein
MALSGIIPKVETSEGGSESIYCISKLNANGFGSISFGILAKALFFHDRQ